MKVAVQILAPNDSEIWGPLGELGWKVFQAIKEIEKAVADLPDDLVLEVHSKPKVFPVHYDEYDGSFWGGG